MLAKKFHFLEYGFHIYDEKSLIPFYVSDGQIRKNFNPKNPAKIKKIFSKKLKSLSFITVSQIQNKDLNAAGVFVGWLFIAKQKQLY